MNSIFYNQSHMHTFSQVYGQNSFCQLINYTHRALAMTDYWLWTDVAHSVVTACNCASLYANMVPSADDTIKVDVNCHDAMQTTKKVHAHITRGFNYWSWHQTSELVDSTYANTKYCCCTYDVMNNIDSTCLKQQMSTSTCSANRSVMNVVECLPNASWFRHQEIDDEEGYDYVVKISLDDSDVGSRPSKPQRHNRQSTKQSSGLKFRNDVIFKTIFRCFRKHYIKDFKRHFDFVKHRDSDQVFADKVREYLVSHFGFESELLANVFVCVIDTKQKYYQVSDAQVSAKINELMYNFSNNRMLELLDCAEFALILKSFEALCYLNMRDNFNYWVQQFYFWCKIILWTKFWKIEATDNL